MNLRMRPSGIGPCLVVAAALLATEPVLAQFVVFPKAGELIAPDRRFAVRSSDREGADSDFVGTFHSLWLTDLTTHHERKLCDYMGEAAVAWSGNEFLMVTQYVGKKTSRALVFSREHEEISILLDKSQLVSLLPVELRSSLRENDHVFVEASRVESNTVFFRVWGYGAHDSNGFRWRCQYVMSNGTANCGARSNSP